MSAVLVLQEKDKDGKVLRQTYFAGYKRLPNKATDGPLWTAIRAEAYEFEAEGHAERVLGSDDRLKGCVVR